MIPLLAEASAAPGAGSVLAAVLVLGGLAWLGARIVTRGRRRPPGRP